MQRLLYRVLKKGYTPFVVQPENSRWYKVRVGPYPSKDEAWQVVEDLKKKHAVSALVVLSKKWPPEVEDSIDIDQGQGFDWQRVLRECDGIEYMDNGSTVRVRKRRTVPSQKSLA